MVTKAPQQSLLFSGVLLRKVCAGCAERGKVLIFLQVLDMKNYDDNKAEAIKKKNKKGNITCIQAV